MATNSPRKKAMQDYIKPDPTYGALGLRKWNAEQKAGKTGSATGSRKVRRTGNVYG